MGVGIRAPGDDASAGSTSPGPLRAFYGPGEPPRLLALNAFPDLAEAARAALGRCDGFARVKAVPAAGLLAEIVLVDDTGAAAQARARFGVHWWACVEAKNHFASSLRDQDKSAGFPVETTEAAP